MKPLSVVYCGHSDCGVGYGVGGARPQYCPTCKRKTTWTTVPRLVDRLPVVPALKLNATDLGFLHALRISVGKDVPRTNDFTDDDVQFLRGLRITLPKVADAND